jgi:ABC-type Na+ efflux pump permease subunit
MIGQLADRQEQKLMEQRRYAIWKFLIGVFAVFWLVFAIILFNANIPFLAVTMALSMVLAMSAVVVGLAWAYHNDV